jgi:hypothetical protein
LRAKLISPSMHQKFIDHGRYRMQNNPLPIKSHVELEDNSDVIQECVLEVETTNLMQSSSIKVQQVKEIHMQTKTQIEILHTSY